MDGARGAFELIVNAFADGDKDALRGLLADQVYERYADAIDKRVAAGHRQMSDLIRIEKSEIEEAGVEVDTAKVTVRFQAEIASAITDDAGEVVEGDPTKIGRVVELWSFERAFTAEDPNWWLTRVSKGV